MRLLRSAAVKLLFVVPIAAGTWIALVHASTPAVPPGGSCHAHNGRPDAHCTPGAFDSHVTQANIHSTVCVSGYTRSVRPPVSYTEPLKRKLLASYGYYAGHSLSAYELDHRVPLELGGAPRSVKNLWPEAHAGAHGSFKKDAVENRLHRDVCERRTTLAGARRAILRWPR